MRFGPFWAVLGRFGPYWAVSGASYLPNYKPTDCSETSTKTSQNGPKPYIGALKNAFWAVLGCFGPFRVLLTCQTTNPPKHHSQDSKKAFWCIFLTNVCSLESVPSRRCIFPGLNMSVVLGASHLPSWKPFKTSFSRHQKYDLVHFPEQSRTIPDVCSLRIWHREQPISPQSAHGSN